MEVRSISIPEEQFTKLVDAHKTTQNFLASSVSPNELYHEHFLNRLEESENDVLQHNVKEVRSLNDITS